MGWSFIFCTSVHTLSTSPPLRVLLRNTPLRDVMGPFEASGRGWSLGHCLTLASHASDKDWAIVPGQRTYLQKFDLLAFSPLHLYWLSCEWTEYSGREEVFASMEGIHLPILDFFFFYFLCRFNSLHSLQSLIIAHFSFQTSCHP